MPLNAILCAVIVGGLCSQSDPVACDERFPTSCASSYAAVEEVRVPYPRPKPRVALQKAYQCPALLSFEDEAVGQSVSSFGGPSDLSLRINHSLSPSQMGSAQPRNIEMQNRVHKTLEEIFVLQRRLLEIQLSVRADKLLAERQAFRSK